MIEDVIELHLNNEANRDIFNMCDNFIDSFIKIQVDVMQCNDKLEKNAFYAMILEELLGSDYKTIGEFLDQAKTMTNNELSK